MDEVVRSFVVLLVVLDPVGVAWLFALLTRRQPRAAQRAMALRGVGLAALLLLLFFFAGETLLSLLGIGLPAFRIAGGIVLFLLAIDMIFARQSGLRSTTTTEQREAELKTDVSVFPLAFPLLAGPGALTTVMLFAPVHREAPMAAALLGVIVTVLTITLAALWVAPLLARQLGETGANVVSRLLGLVLAALAVQYVLDGLGTSQLLQSA